MSTGWPCGGRGTFNPPSTAKYLPLKSGTWRLPGRTKRPVALSAMNASSSQLSHSSRQASTNSSAIA